LLKRALKKSLELFVIREFWAFSGISSKYSGDLAGSRFDEPLRSFVNIEVDPVRKPRLLNRGWVVYQNFGAFHKGRGLKPRRF
jgi:hypothetical protein